MKKRLIVGLIGCTLALSLVGCGEGTVTTVNVENSNELNNTILGGDAFIKISGELYYDSTTRIVWLKNYSNGYGCSYIPYPAPNGLPYRYNPETNTFEEINCISK